MFLKQIHRSLVLLRVQKQTFSLCLFLVFILFLYLFSLIYHISHHHVEKINKNAHFKLFWQPAINLQSLDVYKRKRKKNISIKNILKQQTLLSDVHRANQQLTPCLDLFLTLTKLQIEFPHPAAGMCVL